MLLITVTILLVVSVVANVFLLIKIKKQKPQKQESYDARQLLHDLTVHGSAMVKVERIDPNDIFLRSPRDR